MSQSSNNPPLDENPFKAPQSRAEAIDDPLRVRRRVLIVLGVLLVPLAATIAFGTVCVGITLATLESIHHEPDITLGVVLGLAAALMIGGGIIWLLRRNYIKHKS